jgi:predicted transcriptional regulator
VRELADEGLIQDRGYKNEVFGVTHKGYAAIENPS